MILKIKEDEDRKFEVIGEMNTVDIGDMILEKVFRIGYAHVKNTENSYIYYIDTDVDLNDKDLNECIEQFIRENEINKLLVLL